MDTPQTTAPQLARALASLTAGTVDASFGPAEDGGFWALGLREPGHPRTPGLLLGVPMSRDDTGAVQHARLTAAGLRVELLPELRDIDHAADARAVAEAAPASHFAARYAHIAASLADAPTAPTAPHPARPTGWTAGPVTA